MVVHEKHPESKDKWKNVFCVFLEGFLRIEDWQRKQSYQKLKKEKQTKNLKR